MQRCVEAHQRSRFADSGNSRCHLCGQSTQVDTPSIGRSQLKSKAGGKDWYRSRTGRVLASDFLDQSKRV